MDATFNLLFRFLPRTNVGTPNARAPVASVAVWRKARRLGKRDDDDDGWDDFMAEN
jgi:hypothetical protein